MKVLTGNPLTQEESAPRICLACTYAESTSEVIIALTVAESVTVKLFPVILPNTVKSDSTNKSWLILTSVLSMCILELVGCAPVPPEASAAPLFGVSK